MASGLPDKIVSASNGQQFTPSSKAVGELLEQSMEKPLAPASLVAKLTSDYVLVQHKQAPNRTAGGVLLPDSMQPIPTEGVVVEVGGGQYTNMGHRVQPEVRRGDRVRFFPNAVQGMQKFTHEGQDYPLILMHEGDIFAVLEAAPQEPTGGEKFEKSYRSKSDLAKL